MQSICRKRIEAPQVEPFEQVQRDQSGEALSVGRAFVDAIAAIGHADWRLPLGGMPGQVVGRHAAAGLPDYFCDGFGDLALIKGLLARIGYFLEGARQARVLEDFAGARRAAVNCQLAAVERGLELPLCAARPKISCQWRDRESLLRQPNRRCEDFRHIFRSMLLNQVAPARARSWDGDRVRMKRRDRKSVVKGKSVDLG